MATIDSCHHPLLYQISESSKWKEKDDFPSTLALANEVEQWLKFINTKYQWDRFLPRLREEPKERDETLAEIAVAYYFETQQKWPIVEWEPLGLDLKLGEFLMRFPQGDVFVEVKSPGWERAIAERCEGLSPEEKRKNIQGRLSQGKHSPTETGSSYGPVGPVRYAIEKAYDKFREDIPNLLVINDDLEIDLSGQPEAVEIALFQPEKGSFTDGRFERVGGIGIFNVLKGMGTPVPMYYFKFFPNPFALDSVKIPEEPVKEFLYKRKEEEL